MRRRGWQFPEGGKDRPADPIFDQRPDEAECPPLPEEDPLLPPGPAPVRAPLHQDIGLVAEVGHVVPPPLADGDHGASARRQQSREPDSETLSRGEDRRLLEERLSRSGRKRPREQAMDLPRRNGRPDSQRPQEITSMHHGTPDLLLPLRPKSTTSEEREKRKQERVKKRGSCCRTPAAWGRFFRLNSFLISSFLFPFPKW